jgi:DNA-binding MarR family transcriptional regulator
MDACRLAGHPIGAMLPICRFACVVTASPRIGVGASSIARQLVDAPRMPRGRRKPSVDESIVLALFDLSNHLTRRGESLAAAAGLTTQQWLVLLQVARDPNFPRAPDDKDVLASDIAAHRGVSRATVSVALSELKRRNYVRETVGAKDARRRVLAITAKGRAVLASIEPSRRAANRRLLRSISASDRARFLRMLLACLDVISALESKDGK